MSIVKLQGGLGNQMFQYALARRLKLSFDKVFLDISLVHFKSETRRKYALDCFSLNKDIKLIKNCHVPIIFRQPASDFLKILLTKIRFKGCFNGKWNYVLESKKRFYNELFINKNCYIDGYWQDERYFKEIRDILLREFSLKFTSGNFLKWQELIVNSNSVSLHVRRGDYLSNPSAAKIHSVCSLDYYQKAIEVIRDQVEKPCFFVFSDDLNWVKGNLPLSFNEMVFVDDENLRDYEELTLMSKCKNNIIANSSFSWWGAWLNDNSDKIVIAPNIWYKTNDQPKDLIPEKWIKI